MKVADLMDDLETGDRSMEHLKKGTDPGEGLTFQSFRDALSNLNASGQGIFSGQTNQFWNQQLSNMQWMLGASQSMLGASMKGW